MRTHFDPHSDEPLEDNSLVQPGLDPRQTGAPKPSDPRTDPKPGQKKKPEDASYEPGS